MSALNIMLTTIGSAVIWPLAFAVLIFLMIILWLSVERMVNAVAGLLFQLRNEHRGDYDNRAG